jgi:hypothetical protein
VAVLEEDLDQLYDDLFIETAADWAVPYISDLVGFRPLHGVAAGVSSPRAEVANTIALRRRKGTAAMLEQLARDVTGWEAARAVEFFELLATTQYLDHPRPENRAWVDLRRHEALARLGTPFEQVAHTLDARRIASRRGRFNIPNLGIFLWRLHAYPVDHGTAREVAPGSYTFHPLGLDAPLFNVPRTETAIEQLAAPVNVPEPLRRRSLYDELEALRQAAVDGGAPKVAPLYFADPPDRRVLRVFLDDGSDPVPEIEPVEILICDLSAFQPPPAQLPYRPSGKAPDDPSPDPLLDISVAVDPVLGRLAFPAGEPASGVTVRVSYAYGFSDDIGGGPYARPDLPAPDVSVEDAASLASALASLPPAGPDHVIQLDNSATYGGDLTIAPAAGQRLRVQAATGERPVIDGDITIDAAEDARVILDGLLVGGRVQVDGGGATTLVLRDCTLAPWRELDPTSGDPLPPAEPSLHWLDTGAGRLLVLDRAISGRLQLGDGVLLDARDSVVDALADDAIVLASAGDGSTPADRVELARVTFIGALHARELLRADDSIFTGVATSERRQAGCARFSYLPDGSRTPRQFRCQPQVAAGAAIAAAQQLDPALSDAGAAAIALDVQARVRPVFTSRTWGDPRYAQLATSCPAEISAGAEDGDEMGVFHDLYSRRREANLRARLDEYLRFGLEAGIFYAT